MYTIFYHKPANLYHRPFSQSSNRRVGSCAFKTEEEAIEFAKTVPAFEILYPTGNFRYL